MTGRRASGRQVLVGAGLAGLIVLGGCKGDAGPDAKPTPLTALDAETAPADVVTIDADPGVTLAAGTTPMADRVAVIGLLNKRNGSTRELTLKPGHAVRVGDAVVRLLACEQTAPWEQDHYTGAFVQLDVLGPSSEKSGMDNRGAWRRVFSGWLYKERPALNVVLHPIYDVWPKSCAMTFPGGARAPSDAAPDAGKPRSSAKKSAAPAAVAPAPTTPSTADDNSDR